MNLYLHKKITTFVIIDIQTGMGTFQITLNKRPIFLLACSIPELQSIFASFKCNGFGHIINSNSWLNKVKSTCISWGKSSRINLLMIELFPTDLFPSRTILIFLGLGKFCIMEYCVNSDYKLSNTAFGLKLGRKSGSS